MLGLALEWPAARPLQLLALGAHPDDIEIGAGGTLLRLSEQSDRLRVRTVVMTGSPLRQEEARVAASAFADDPHVELHDLPEGRLPSMWADVKGILEAIAREVRPDLILAPSALDAHQDHRTIAEIVPTVFRDSLCLSYEIPKWDGDMWRPSVYVPLSAETALRKAELLSKCYVSQLGRDWWDEQTFLGLARLRGVECHAKYAEAFGCNKAVLTMVGR